MEKNSITKQIVLFIAFFIVILLTNNIVKDYLISNEIYDYNTHLLVKTASNIILTLISFLFIWKNDLSNLGGLNSYKPEKKHLLWFPLLYFVALNLVFADDIPNFSLYQILILTVYCVSIGFSEEFSLRGVLLPLFIKLGSKDKKSITKAIIISALAFGLAHLIKFDKGIFGEISQLFFATFIGFLFGALLIATKSIYPLIIIHALIDFAAKIDRIGIPFEKGITNQTDLTGAVFSVILSLPCLLFGLYVIKKHIPEKIQLDEY